MPVRHPAPDQIPRSGLQTVNMELQKSCGVFFCVMEKQNVSFCPLSHKNAPYESKMSGGHLTPTSLLYKNTLTQV